MTDKPLFLLMEEAFDGALQDDCFYEWNEVAAAMLRAIADRMVETHDPDSEDLGVAQWLEEEAALAETWDNKQSYDPRNLPTYDTFTYGTEPLPGDTTWAKTKASNG
jgi:gamma-glutamyltranspeptidase